MESTKALNLMIKYKNCPNCRNEKIGGQEGKLVIEEGTFKRECKCGFKITVDADRQLKEPSK